MYQRQSKVGGCLTACIRFFALSPPLAMAETPVEEAPAKTSETAVEQIVVTATRTNRAVSDVPASVTVINADEIARRSVKSPEALLQNEAGVDLVITPGGVVDRIVLRGIPEGFSGNTTQYLLNGMPVDPLQIATNRTVWHLLSVADIERLEVVRGPASALYGANAMGGVINIITKQGAGDLFMRLDLEGGSHNGNAVGLQGGGSFGDVDLFLSARDSRSDGYRSTLESSWGGLDYDLSGRESEGRRFNASLSYWPTERQKIAVGVYRYEQQDDWLGGHPHQRSDSDGTSADFAYRQELGDASRLTFKLLTLDSTSDAYMDNSYEEIPEDALVLEDQYEDRERSTSAEFQLDLQPMEGHTLILGTTYSIGTWEFNGSERYSDYPNWTPYSKRSESQVAALFIQDEVALGERAILTLGGRYDHYQFERIQVQESDRPNARDSMFTPRAGIRYRLSDTYSFYTSAGKGYIPANPSLMYRGGGNWLDNDHLEPERSTSWEAGLNFSWLSGGLDGSLALYRTDYEDRITSIYVTGDAQPCTVFPCYRQYQNISAIRIKGAELMLNAKIGQHWRPFFNYTLSAAEIRENESDPETEGNSPAYTPRHKINLGASYVGNPGFGARVAGRYVSIRYWSDRHYDWTQLGNFFVVDTKLTQSFRLGGKLPEMELSLALNNLFDQTYSEWKGELADGRNWRLGVAANF